MPPHMNMSFAVVQPEPIATVLMVDCPAGVMLQTAAENPTIAKTAPTLTEPSGIAVKTERATALTTVVVTILEEKFVSIIAHVMKNKIIEVKGMFAVRGCKVAVSHSLIPTVLLVKHEPSQVAAPVIKIEPHKIPFDVTSLKFIILSNAAKKRRHCCCVAVYSFIKIGSYASE